MGVYRFFDSEIDGGEMGRKKSLRSKAAHFVSDLTTVLLNPISDKTSSKSDAPHPVRLLSSPCNCFFLLELVLLRDLASMEDFDDGLILVVDDVGIVWSSLLYADFSRTADCGFSP